MLSRVRRYVATSACEPSRKWRSGSSAGGAGGQDAITLPSASASTRTLVACCAICAQVARTSSGSAIGPGTVAQAGPAGPPPMLAVDGRPDRARPPRGAPGGPQPAPARGGHPSGRPAAPAGGGGGGPKAGGVATPSPPPPPHTPPPPPR